LSSIGNVQQIVAVIRQQLAARAVRADSRGQKASSQGAAPRSPADLFAHVGERVKAIDRDDPDRGRKAFRVFLESVLLGELGESLINDPQFYRVVDDVQRQMEADPEVAASIDAAIDHLLSASA
jgi:hypothetical protein